ncbi:MAG: hypothetical protein ACRDPY_30815 [Streptosporangiaceae bacterium]
MASIYRVMHPSAAPWAAVYPASQALLPWSDGCPPDPRIALPDGDPVDLYADGDLWTDDPVAGADLAGEGWLLISTVAVPDFRWSLPLM